MKKAYRVLHDEEGFVCIVFAENNATARRDGSIELNIEVDELSCQRAPEFDSYAAQGYVPPLVLIDHGWRFECANCYEELFLESDVVKRENMLDRGAHQVFCDQACLDALDQRIIDRNAQHEVFVEKVKAIRPDLDWQAFRGHYPLLNSSATFQFTGSQYGGSVREQNGELTWMIAQGDREAWKTYEANRLHCEEQAEVVST